MTPSPEFNVSQSNPEALQTQVAAFGCCCDRIGHTLAAVGESPEVSVHQHYSLPVTVGGERHRQP
jgi:hypothetical protein